MNFKYYYKLVKWTTSKSMTSSHLLAPAATSTGCCVPSLKIATDFAFSRFGLLVLNVRRSQLLNEYLHRKGWSCRLGLVCRLFCRVGSSFPISCPSQGWKESLFLFDTKTLKVCPPLSPCVCSEEGRGRVFSPRPCTSDRQWCEWRQKLCHRACWPEWGSPAYCCLCFLNMARSANYASYYTMP